jgi:ACT domain-containing protein
MMMIVDMSTSKKTFADCASELQQLGEQIGVSIKCQREEIFSQMHRI